MSFSLTSPITGGAQTGFTSPTYTIAVDSSPNGQAGKQYAVTAIGGTQTGVDTSSSPSNPFTVNLARPAVLRTIGPVDPVTGALRSVPRNTYKIIVRKGALPLAGQPKSVLNATLSVDVPAGADSADAANVRAAISLMIGSLNSISASIGDSLVSGVI
jgi:hypothetical protein